MKRKEAIAYEKKGKFLHAAHAAGLKVIDSSQDGKKGCLKDAIAACLNNISIDLLMDIINIQIEKKHKRFIFRFVFKYSSSTNQLDKYFQSRNVHKITSTFNHEAVYDLIYQSILGDGDCLYKAVALYCGKDQQTLRNLVASHIRHNLDEYKDLINGLECYNGRSIEEYLKAIEIGKEWADNLEIAVLMKILDRPIIIVESNNKIKNLSNVENSEGLMFRSEPIFVYYNGHNHYDALICRDDENSNKIDIFNKLKQGNINICKLGTANTTNAELISCTSPTIISADDGACAIAAIYAIAGINYIGAAARKKAVQELNENISDSIIKELIKSEIKGALFSDNELSYLKEIKFIEQSNKDDKKLIEVIKCLKVTRLNLIEKGEKLKKEFFQGNDLPDDVNKDNKSYADLFIEGSLDSYCTRNIEEDKKNLELLSKKAKENAAVLDQFIENKVLDYINIAVASSNFWLGVAYNSPGVMGALAKIHGINFRIFSKTGTKENTTNINKIDIICTHISDPNKVIHDIHLQSQVDSMGAQRSTENFELLEEISNPIESISVINAKKYIQSIIESIINTKDLIKDEDIIQLCKLLDIVLIIVNHEGKVINRPVLDGEPKQIIFVYYDNVNHYSALLVKEGYSAEKILDFLLQKAPDEINEHAKNKTENTSIGSDGERYLEEQKIYQAPNINNQGNSNEYEISSAHSNHINEESSIIKIPVKPLGQILAEIVLGSDAEDNLNELETSETQINDWRELEKNQTNALEQYKRDYSQNPPLLKLIESYDKVKQCYSKWKDKFQGDIQEWAADKSNKSDLEEAIAVMDRANELITNGHRLRDPQLLSILIFLQTEGRDGRLCQIKTGEGKTTIVSFLATIKALQGEQVDVITSNPVLALEGVKDKSKFYQLFNLKVDTNNTAKDDNYVDGPKGCYGTDILYGCISNFQFDYLRDNFERLKTRGKRKFGTVILDEVDNMLIDNGGHIAKLSGPLPGMENLKYTYIKIWAKLNELSPDTYLSTDISCLKEKIKASNVIQEDMIPGYLQEFVKLSLDRWIENAINAKYKYHEDCDYIIKEKDGERIVIPVDYINTGVTLENTIWSHGLHQFVQLKHELHLTSESLTSSFISNLSYIKKYNKIFGLTGTLGSKAEQDLLSTIYNIDYAKIPTFKQKQFEELPLKVMSDDQEWIDEIVNCNTSYLNQGRSVLIICKTIKDANSIQDKFKASQVHCDIKMYRDEDESKIVEEGLKPRVVIISTNLAGRGTDLKTTDDLENAGGLHVCVAFLPSNKRIEDQAFGRTSRQGKKGTAQIIMRKIELTCGIDCSVEQVKFKRDTKEKERISKIKENKIKQLQFDDDCAPQAHKVWARKFRQCA